MFIGCVRSTPTKWLGDRMDPLYTYNYICMKDKSTLNLEISKPLDYKPKCLKCNSSRLVLRYTIIDDQLWLNNSVLHE